MTDAGSEPIQGGFHPWPPGTVVWECTTCRGHFAWGEHSLAFGNVDEAEAVFCSQRCADQWKRPRKRGPPVVPFAVIDARRMPVGWRGARLGPPS